MPPGGASKQVLGWGCSPHLPGVEIEGYCSGFNYVLPEHIRGSGCALWTGSARAASPGSVAGTQVLGLHPGLWDETAGSEPRSPRSNNPQHGSADTLPEFTGPSAMVTTHFLVLHIFENFLQIKF